MITITTSAILFRDKEGNSHRSTGPAYFVDDLYFIAKYYYQNTPPLSSVRVLVEGVEERSEESQRKIEQVAQEIMEQTGHHVEIMLGSAGGWPGGGLVLCLFSYWSCFHAGKSVQQYQKRLNLAGVAQKTRLWGGWCMVVSRRLLRDQLGLNGGSWLLAHLQLELEVFTL